MARVGVFGGSFNPIHHGHLLLADEVRELLGLDRVLFVPAGAPPHKSAAGLAPAADRHAMVRLAVADHPGLAVSDVELRRPGPSYTVDTLEALATEGDQLFLLVGSETFLDLLSWREPAPSWYMPPPAAGVLGPAPKFFLNAGAVGPANAPGAGLGRPRARETAQALAAVASPKWWAISLA